MHEMNAPLFRKAGRGYNKEDVNAYIINLNRILEDNKRNYERILSERDRHATEDMQRISSLLAKVEELEKLENEISERNALIEELRAECERKDEAIVSLRNAVSELEKLRTQNSGADEAEKAKAEYYDSLCSKAGEILVIASSTAETILDRANSEAQRIVGDANTKKEQMLKSLTESVDAATGDINVYIRNAVEDCIAKINKSVNDAKEAGEIGTKKPKAVFVNEN